MFSVCLFTEAWYSWSRTSPVIVLVMSWAEKRSPPLVMIWPSLEEYPFQDQGAPPPPDRTGVPPIPGQDWDTPSFFPHPHRPDWGYNAAAIHFLGSSRRALFYYYYRPHSEGCGKVMLLLVYVCVSVHTPFPNRLRSGRYASCGHAGGLSCCLTLLQLFNLVLVG